MVSGEWIIALFEAESNNDIVNRVSQISRQVGFDINVSEDDKLPSGTYVLPIQYKSFTTNLQFRPDDDRSGEPMINFGKLVYPEKGESDEQAIEAIFELICRSAVDLEASYIPMFNTQSRGEEVVPDDRPIGEAIETPPRFGVYADEVLADLGGVDELFDHEPWYVAQLGDHHTLVIEAESPWGDWRPPTEAPYIESAQFGDGVPEHATTGSDGTDLSDPFAALDPGEYGTEVCVDPDEVEAGFRDADLDLVRVYVDDDRNLRRVEDDRFVRSVIVDGPDDSVAFVDAMLTETPDVAPPSTPRASALLNDVIPPAFVRAGAPDEETVVSRVLALPVETNKIELLASLGRAYRQSDEMDVTTVESALEELADVDDPRQVEQFIEARLV